MPDFAILSDTYNTQTIPSVKNIRGQHIVANNLVDSPPDYFQYAISDDNVDTQLKDLGVVFKNKTTQQLTVPKKLDILDGLILSQNAGLKLPKVIEIEEDTYNGHFNSLHPRKISFDASLENLSLVTVHETLHKNHMTNFNLFFRMPDVDYAKQLIDRYRVAMGSELRYHAFDNIFEFVACVGEKLITEQKNWSDLDPIISKLYDYFKGPILKL